ncbi:MAG: RNB domain-containing ribonuclease [Pirellulales bacterium]
MNAAAGGFRRLREVARRAMIERGLDPDFPPAALRQLDSIQSPPNSDGAIDLRELLWCSIDNDDSRDLDQLTVAEELMSGETKVLVAIADVDSLVAAGSAIDRHAQHNTTSVYTAAQVFSMLPEKLSTDLTSLCEGRDRAAMVTEMLIGANGVSARFLDQRRSPSLRRVVRTPKRWNRIVEVAAEHGEALPAEPNAVALAKFLRKRREADPLRFPDLSLTVVKLLGRGEYVAELPGQKPPGHFGLAVRDYTHSTAPNRRFPDLITQRLLKAALNATAIPYGEDELDGLARHCTQQEDAASKVERRVRKSAAALFLSKRLGATFDALVTGAAEKGTWVRVLGPPVEGKLVEGARGLDVGHRLRVKLVNVDVEQGFVDFVRA